MCLTLLWKCLSSRVSRHLPPPTRALPSPLCTAVSDWGVVLWPLRVCTVPPVRPTSVLPRLPGLALLPACRVEGHVVAGCGGVSRCTSLTSFSSMSDCKTRLGATGSSYPFYFRTVLTGPRKVLQCVRGRRHFVLLRPSALLPRRLFGVQPGGEGWPPVTSGAALRSEAVAVVWAARLLPEPDLPRRLSRPDVPVDLLATPDPLSFGTGRVPLCVSPARSVLSFDT